MHVSLNVLRTNLEKFRQKKQASPQTLVKEKVMVLDNL